MNAQDVERLALTRIIEALNVLSRQYGVHLLPELLRRATGSPAERSAQRFDALAGVLEALAYEGIKPGLAQTLLPYGYTVAALRDTPDDELAQIDGVGEATIRAMRRALDLAQTSVTHEAVVEVEETEDVED